MARGGRAGSTAQWAGESEETPSRGPALHHGPRRRARSAARRGCGERRGAGAGERDGSPRQGIGVHRGRHRKLASSGETAQDALGRRTVHGHAGAGGTHRLRAPGPHHDDGARPAARRGAKRIGIPTPRRQEAHRTEPPGNPAPWAQGRRRRPGPRGSKGRAHRAGNAHHGAPRRALCRGGQLLRPHQRHGPHARTDTPRGRSPNHMKATTCARNLVYRPFGPPRRCSSRPARGHLGHPRLKWRQNRPEASLDGLPFTPPWFGNDRQEFRGFLRSLGYRNGNDRADQDGGLKYPTHSRESADLRNSQ